METTAEARAEVAARLRLAIVRLARRLRQEAGQELTPTLAAALGTVERHGPLTPSELAEHERVRRPTATRIVASLVEGGLVERAGDPADRRSSVISVSAEGRAVLRRLRGRKNAYLARRLRELGAADLEALERATAVLEELVDREAR